MPYDDPDPEDPTVLVGVSLPADVEALENMAYTFAEEFAGLGHDEAWIGRMFRSPAYAGPHQAWRVLGDEAIVRIVRESVAVFGRVRFVTRERNTAGLRALPMVDPRDAADRET